MQAQANAPKIWVAGHSGMLGSALVRRLERDPCRILTATRDELDLTDQQAVRQWVAEARPDAIIIAAARVGGIMANRTCPAEFLYENLMIAANIIHAAHQADVDRLIQISSSAVYPATAEQPIGEEAFLHGPPDDSHYGYALAKMAAMGLTHTYAQQYGRRYVSAVPTNLYGPGDNFDPQTSHVVPALIRKVWEAKAAGAPVTLWGSGTPRRELLYVDDCADACVFLLNQDRLPPHVNIGSGTEVTIYELVQMICSIADYDGAIALDPSKPDGAMRRRIDSGLLHDLGWRPTHNLAEGLRETCRYYREVLS